MKKIHITNMLLLAFLLLSSIIQAQTNPVKGKVTDSEGSPLPGVSILIEGTTTGTETDFDGLFSINASKGQTLVFSFIGMKTQKAQVGTLNFMTVKLLEETNQLEEVVLTGYTKQSTKNITGSVAVVKMKKCN